MVKESLHMEIVRLKKTGIRKINDSSRKYTTSGFLSLFFKLKGIQFHHSSRTVCKEMPV